MDPNSHSELADKPQRAHRPIRNVGRWGACQSCRQRKTRCDGKAPCFQCTISNRECAFLPKVKHPGPALSSDLAQKLEVLQGRYLELLNMQADKPQGETSDQLTTNSNREADIPNTSTVGCDVNISDEDRTRLFVNLHIFFFKYCILVGYASSRAEYPKNFDDFQARMLLSDEAQHPHPVLVQCMTLMGIHFECTVLKSPDEPGRRSLMAALIHQIQREFFNALAYMDRLLDYITASNLLTYWYYRESRLQEGQYLASTTARLVIAAGLHHIDPSMLRGISNEQLSSESPLPWDTTLLGRPKNLIEVGHRIRLFWQSFTIEKLVAMVTGLPSAYGDSSGDVITTVWPRPRSEYESGIAFQASYLTSINEVPVCQRPSTESPCSLASQALMLTDRANRFSLSHGAQPLEASSKAQESRGIDDLWKSLHTFEENFRAWKPMLKAQYCHVPYSQA